MFLFNNYFYLITIALQVICVIHCLRHGKQNPWLWIIIFLPAVGCIAYAIMEIFSGNEVNQLQSGLSNVFNPTGRIKKLEDNLRFSDTFNNRVMLADAYLAAGRKYDAIELYESSLTGAFEENEHVLFQLIIAYSQTEQYSKVIEFSKRIYKLPQFARSKQHILYAIALDHSGKKEEAEKEFLTMKARFSNYEARYEYGKFLLRNARKPETIKLYNEIIEERSQLSPRERNYNRNWFSLIKEEMKRL